MSLHVGQAVPVHADDFTRPNSTNLGPYWVETGGDLGIVSNLLAVQGTTNGRRAAIYQDQTQTPWQTVEFTIGTAPNSSTASGAVLRVNATMNQMMLFGVSSTGWSLGRITGINGTYTGLGTHAVTIAAGATVRVSCDQDNVWRVYINGVKTGPSFVDATWADNDHRYVGLFVQRDGLFPAVNSASLGGFRGTDTPRLTLVDADDFNRASLGPDWTTYGGGNLYISGGEISGVGTPSEPISYAIRNTPVPGYSKVQVVRARLRWNGRNPEHSATSVGLRADFASGHNGAHFVVVANLIAILWFDESHPNGYLPAAGTDLTSTSKLPENALLELRAEDTVYTASVNGAPVLQGTFTTTQIPLTNRQHIIQIQDDSAVSGGGEPPANLDDFTSLIM